MKKFDQSEVERSADRFALMALIVLITGAVALVTLIGLKKPQSGTRTDPSEFVKVTREVIANRSMVIGVNNATLYVPEGAATMPGVISIIPREPNLFATVGEKGWVRSQVVNIEYWNKQGTPYPEVSFTVSVRICFKITDQYWRVYTREPGDFQIQYYAESLKPARWESLPLTAQPDRLELCGDVDHLSIFALAIRQTAIIPTATITVPTLNRPYAP